MISSRQHVYKRIVVANPLSHLNESHQKKIIAADGFINPKTVGEWERGGGNGMMQKNGNDYILWSF